MHSGKKKLFGRPPCVIAEVSTVSDGSWDGFVLFVCFFQTSFSIRSFCIFAAFWDIWRLAREGQHGPLASNKRNTSKHVPREEALGAAPPLLTQERSRLSCSRCSTTAFAAHRSFKSRRFLSPALTSQKPNENLVSDCPELS